MFFQTILLLLNLNKRIQRELLSFATLLTVLDSLPTRNIQRYKWKLQNRRQRQPQLNRHQGPRNQGDLRHIDLYERTGLFTDDFTDLYHALRATITLPRCRYPQLIPRRKVSTTLSPVFRLVLALDYLRNGPKYKRFTAVYRIPKGHVCKEVHHIIPKIYSYLSYKNIIGPPVQWFKHSFEDVVGAIDCTSHFRCRVHPKQANYYRYDKAGFFITSQVICDLSGRLISVCLGLGHNNDQGMLNITDIKRFLERHNIKLLGDGGYSFHLIVTPDEYKGTAWNNKQKALRSCVETAIGMSKCWGIAAEKVRIGPDFQQYCLMIVYFFVAMILKQYPLRTSLVQ